MTAPMQSITFRSSSQYREDGTLIVKTKSPEPMALPNPILHEDSTVMVPSSVPPSIFSPIVGTTTSIKMSLFLCMIHTLAEKVHRYIKPVEFVNRVLPAGMIDEGARYVAACLTVWLILLDITSDDTTSPLDWKYATELLRRLSEQPYSQGLSCRFERTWLVDLFCAMVRASTIEGFDENFVETRIQDWKASFWTEVHHAVDLMWKEKSSTNNRGLLNRFSYVKLMRLTIRPFMVLARASFSLDANLESAGSAALSLWGQIESIEKRMQTIAGIQMDILMWPKAFVDHDHNNMVEKRMIEHGERPEGAFKWTLHHHNQLVKSLYLALMSAEGSQLEWMSRHPGQRRWAQGEFDKINGYTHIVTALGGALVHWARLTGLWGINLDTMSFPESVSRAKYRALEEEEEFGALLNLPEA